MSEKVSNILELSFTVVLVGLVLTYSKGFQEVIGSASHLYNSSIRALTGR